MSTQTKRAPRPVKPKAVAPAAAPAEAAPAPTADEPATLAAPAEVVAAESCAAGKRQQTSKAIGVSISSARVRRHIDKLNLNALVDGMIGELKTQLNSYKHSKTLLETGKLTYTETAEVDGKKVSEEKTRDLTADERVQHQATVDQLAPSVAEFEMKVSALSRERTRFSNEASIALSIICDELVQQLTEHTMNRVLAAKKKIIQVNHLHEAGVEKLSLYPLIKSLPSFVAMSEKLAKEAHDSASAALLSAALAQAEKDFKKKFAVHMPKKKKQAVHVAEEAEPTPVAAPVEEEEETDEDVDDSSDSKTSFRFYVGQVCKETVKRDPRYKAVRVSTAIRGYLSNLLVEFIQRLSSLVHLTATNMKNKTINDVAILRTVEALLIDGHSTHEVIEYKDAMVLDPAVLKAESAKREEEKKAGREYKVDLEKVPKVPGVVAVRTVTYPTSGYALLASKVEEKLKLYETLGEKEKAALVTESA